MSKHTPGPWGVRDHGDLTIKSSQGGKIARIWVDVDDERFSNEQKANACRIVKCVNAMEGIGDDNALFFPGNTVRSVISSMASLLSEVAPHVARSVTQGFADSSIIARMNTALGGQLSEDGPQRGECTAPQAAWRMVTGDWRDDLVALHGPEGHIVSGLTVAQARAIIDAHGGVDTSGTAGGAS